MAYYSRKGGWAQTTNKTYRSGLEEKIAEQLQSAGIPVLFEEALLKYTSPAIEHTYTPDFVLPNGILIESKGWMDIADRKKHDLIKEQYPHLDIRFVFSCLTTKIYSGSKTTYAMWCEKRGFLYALKFIPFEWVKEAPKDTTGLIFKGNIEKTKKGENRTKK